MQANGIFNILWKAWRLDPAFGYAGISGVVTRAVHSGNLTVEWIALESSTVRPYSGDWGASEDIEGNVYMSTWCYQSSGDPCTDFGTGGAVVQANAEALP